jgi:hypothetical protein
LLADSSLSISLRTTILFLALAVGRLLLQCPQLPTYLHRRYLPKLVIVSRRLVIDLARDLIMLVVTNQRRKRCKGLEVY